ncbi:putative MFS family arabinose efflux permease [Phyllobacterium endophyticum]|nr:putative MFS family arabinose efflux permease [Phyllobacterium endophyticum]
MPLPILALAIASFCIGTTEFVIMGLLPEVATDLGVSIPSAGLLVTGYALGVVIGAPVIAIATASETSLDRIGDAIRRRQFLLRHSA